MKGKKIVLLVCTLLITMVLPAAGLINETEPKSANGLLLERDYGDAPEGPQAVAYPSLGVMGNFPTCQSVGPALWVQHNNFGAWFGPAVDFEPDGNGGTCPQCFPPYDQDETFMDTDAGLIMPGPFTIDNSLNVVPIPPGVGTPLGKTGQTAVWGIDIDIDVTNTMPSQWQGYFNLIIDWNQNGQWGDPGEHVVFNFWPIPNPYFGPISGLNPPNFIIGPNPGYVWARFTISEKPVPSNWNGAEDFEDGESEDYLLFIDQDIVPKSKIGCKDDIRWTSITPGSTKTANFQIGNIGDPGSFLDWSITSDPAWGTWTFSPTSGTGVAEGTWVTVTATCVVPSQSNQVFTGDITVCNDADPTDCCKINVYLETPRNKAIMRPFLARFLQQLPDSFPILKYLLGL